MNPENPRSPCVIVSPDTVQHSFIHRRCRLISSLHHRHAIDFSIIIDICRNSNNLCHGVFKAEQHSSTPNKEHHDDDHVSPTDSAGGALIVSWLVIIGGGSVVVLFFALSSSLGGIFVCAIACNCIINN
jgi:hypothetical protein